MNILIREKAAADLHGIFERIAQDNRKAATEITLGYPLQQRLLCHSSAFFLIATANLIWSTGDKRELG
jgi:hypothetical protein